MVLRFAVVDNALTPVQTQNVEVLVLLVRLSQPPAVMVVVEDLVAKSQTFVVMVLVLVRVQAAVVPIVKVRVVQKDLLAVVQMVVVQTVDVATENAVRAIHHFVVKELALLQETEKVAVVVVLV